MKLVEQAVRAVLWAEDETFEEVPPLVRRVAAANVRTILRAILPHLSPESAAKLREELKG